MAPVPVMMILYTSDGVEIRYSDGSCLELSPCGSTMIHHDTLERREHPRHDQPLKVQKRTRFVTSEHRHKVVQALDFRNRFAERSYLCEDLLPKEEIVALYAKIDSIAWPKLQEEAKIEVLPDGSRRITSLDEFASLIISPHGHDFTVCYLSRISEDRSKSKAHHSDSRSSVKSFQHSTEKEYSDEINSVSKPNEAVIHPFEITDQSKDMQIKSGNLPCDAHHSQFIGDINQMQELKIINIRPEASQKSEHVAILATQHCFPLGQGLEAPGMNSQQKEIDIENSLQNKDASIISTQTSDIQNNERHLAEPNKPCDIPKEHRHKPSIPFSNASPDSHDISSISRSSTPDGLRTTIDSDATLTHENMADSFHEQDVVHTTRHSSPTKYTSSPYDIQVTAASKKIERMHRNIDVSLSSSFLGNQKFQNQCEQITCDLKTEQLKDLSKSIKDKLLLSTGTDCSKTIIPDTQPLENAAVDQSILLLSDNSESQNIIGHKIQSGPDFSANNNAENDATILDLKVRSRHIHFEPETHITSASSPKLAEICSDSLQVNQEDHESHHRERYIWTTKHCSRNECPIMWIHPLKLTLEETNLMAENTSSHPSMKRLQAVTTTLTTNEKNCTYTAVPLPLPVTCPFQHNHKFTPNYNDDINENSTSSLGEFQHGRLKIVISEGVVYRLVHRAEMNIIEIHPGDGSVFVSEGVKGHFFTHYMLVGDQLEERTYSLKSLPRQKLKGMYSIEKLIETGNRLVMMNNEWKQRGLKEDIPCWKREVVAVVEPLSSSLLEECFVDGLGKFSAFTNGRVRIVFEDRTALDMVCNFSRRIKDCLQHSQEPQASLPCANSVSPPMPTIDSIFGASTGRLLLPSGKYVTVDIKKPGQYRNYIEVAQEWAAWVGSSPLERHQFYSQYHRPAILQQAAEIELKKIFCFNYILEQTMLMQQQQLNGRKSDARTDTTVQPSTQAAADIYGSKIASPKTQPFYHEDATALSHCNLQSSFTPSVEKHLYTTKTFYSPQEQKGSSRDALPLDRSPPVHSHPSDQDHARAMPQRVEPSGSSWASRVEYISNRKMEDTNQGFESVKQVLLQNSNLINDIEQFLESSRKS